MVAMEARFVKLITAITVVFVHTCCSGIIFAGAIVHMEKKDRCLPWRQIADKLHNRALFCTKTDSKDAESSEKFCVKAAVPQNSCSSYALTAAEKLSFRFPSNSEVKTSVGSVDVVLSRWENGSWRECPNLRADSDGRVVNFASGIQTGGFYRIAFPSTRHKNKNVYVIVTENWKQDILAFLRSSMEQIEMNRDAQLFRSGIAKSHFDYVMRIVSESSVFSGEILASLADAVQGKKAFDRGRCPELLKGLNKIRLKRFESDKITEFVVYVPASYESSRKWPLYLFPDPRRFNAAQNYSRHSGFIDVWWVFGSPLEFEWKDFEFLLGVLRNQLNVDEDRFYLYGHCANGISAVALALNYPDRWAECSVSAGNSYLNLAGNALNLPLFYVGGERNNVYYGGYYEFALRCFQYFGCEHLNYDRQREVVQLRGSALPQSIRKKSPKQVFYRIESLENPRAYWIKILGRENENFNAEIRASVEAQVISVRTENVNAYTLDLQQAPVDSNRPVEIIENGKKAVRTKGDSYTKTPNNYNKAVYIKNERLHGPIQDAFTNRYVVVWGDNEKAEKFSEVSKKVAAALAKGAPCFSDVNLPEEMIETHNLILVGSTASNRWLARINEKLPVRIEKDKIITGGEAQDGNRSAFILIYPNPLNSHRYVAVFSALYAEAMEKVPEAYRQMKALHPADAGVFELTDSNEIRWEIIEKFNTLWAWHKDWNQVLGIVESEHTHRRWGQWLACALREQLGADVVFCESPLKLPKALLKGKLTYRDLFYAFDNDWIVKIELSGRDLRNLLLAPIETPQKNLGRIFVDGVLFEAGGNAEQINTLTIGQIRNNQVYTAVLPYQFVNGRKLEVFLQDYEISGEYYIVPTLKAYLCQHAKQDLDDRLDNLIINVF